jgi:hypothetical protein
MGVESKATAVAMMGWIDARHHVGAKRQNPQRSDLAEQPRRS